MATTYQTAKYWYCDDYKVSAVTVTMAIPTCPYIGTIWEDDYCQYETRRKTYTWTLSHSVPYVLTVRYQLTWTQIKDGGVPSSGNVTFTVYIPAGVTSYSLTMGTQKQFSYNGRTYYNYPPQFCQEERWCTWGDSGVYAYPTQV